MLRFPARACLFLSFLAVGLTARAQETAPVIYLNQVGFYTNGPKIAVVSGAASYSRFFILDARSGDTVYRGKLGAEKASLNSSLRLKTADFSALRKDGEYVVSVAPSGNVKRFRVHARPLRDVAVGVLKGFYFQRSNVPLPQQFAGPWRRAGGHPDTVVIVHPSAESPGRKAGSTISSPGGWYDAGDYNKYIVNSGITMNTLLSAYEDFRSYYDTLHTTIPESGDGVPDLLNEVLYNLRWMLTMQDPADGGVYHKCTNAAFDGMVMPGITKDARYVVQKSTAATLDFSAVMAQAARVFKTFDRVLPGLADSCSKAALAAWSWSEIHPAERYDQTAMNRRFSPPVSTGDYGDRNLEDEWRLAAAELFITTADRGYFNRLTSGAQAELLLPSWSQVGVVGWYSLLRHRQSLPTYARSFVDGLHLRLVLKADSLAAKYRSTAFGNVMGLSKSDFIWGSSAVAANQGILLLNAYRLTGNKKFLEAALSGADYLLGRNATGYCFVTGFGETSPMHPHHRQSVADGIAQPVPGLLAGGPNAGRQDHCTYAFTEPERSYTDDDCSYASNEIAINWNAPAVYLFNALEALHARSVRQVAVKN